MLSALPPGSARTVISSDVCARRTTASPSTVITTAPSQLAALPAGLSQTAPDLHGRHQIKPGFGIITDGPTAIPGKSEALPAHASRGGKFRPDSGLIAQVRDPD